MTDETPDLPLAAFYEPEPYYGCPKCESSEYGMENVEHSEGERPIYRCHECGCRFLGVPGAHHA